MTHASSNVASAWNAARACDDDLLAALWQHVQNAASASSLGLDFAREHVAWVERFARRLAPRLGARLDVVMPAAILHDIAAIEDFAQVARHHELGAVRAVEILHAHGLPEELSARIAECVRQHVRPAATGTATAEVVCVSHADAFAQLANPAYFLHYAHAARGLPFAEARAWYLALVRERWQRVEPSLADLLRPYYLRALGACATDADEGLPEQS